MAFTNDPLVCDPVTRLEGHVGVELDLEPTALSGLGFAHQVANTTGTKVFSTMYRGFENILQGRDPRDAIQITQRI